MWCVSLVSTGYTGDLPLTDQRHRDAEKFICYPTGGTHILSLSADSMNQRKEGEHTSNKRCQTQL